MRILVWQWGRRGAGPLVAAAMARRLAAVAGTETVLSLSTGAELLQLADAPDNQLPVRTYTGLPSFALRLATAPFLVERLSRRIRASGIDVALCAMPAPLDLAMAAALRRARLPYAVVVHDAQLHPGDSFPMQIPLQRLLLSRADLVFALSDHVAGQLRGRGLRAGQPLLRASLPPFVFGPPPPPIRSHGGRWRLLSFGRLMPYKGLDLLAAAMERLGPESFFELRVVGSGPDSPHLARLAAMRNVSVENRWVPEEELGELLGWADALVLTHREASQSGVAAAAVAAGRWVVSTRVGGLVEQLEGHAMATLCAPDPISIADAIEGLLRHAAPSTPVFEEWGGTARTMIEGLAGLVPRAAATGSVVRGERGIA